jgi:uncharacterized membrane protein
MGGFLEPNIHPVLVHFAYALSLSALGVYLIGRLCLQDFGATARSPQGTGCWQWARLRLLQQLQQASTPTTQ